MLTKKSTQNNPNVGSGAGNPWRKPQTHQQLDGGDLFEFSNPGSRDRNFAPIGQWDCGQFPLRDPAGRAAEDYRPMRGPVQPISDPMRGDSWNPDPGTASLPQMSRNCCDRAGNPHSAIPADPASTKSTCKVYQACSFVIKWLNLQPLSTNLM